LTGPARTANSRHAQRGCHRHRCEPGIGKRLCGDLARNADIDIVARGARAAHFDELPVTIAHTLRLARLPEHHRDPFDRLLVAQAIEERLTLVTHDPVIARYPVTVLWG